jgi:dTDP-4-dehydrorhamnose 3,5-epimerase
VFSYKCTDFYYPEDEGGIIWNDPGIGIDWLDLGSKYLLSGKDKNRGTPVLIKRSFH